MNKSNNLINSCESMFVSFYPFIFKDNCDHGQKVHSLLETKTNSWFIYNRKQQLNFEYYLDNKTQSTSPIFPSTSESDGLNIEMHFKILTVNRQEELQQNKCKCTNT